METQLNINITDCPSVCSLYVPSFEVAACVCAAAAP